MEYKTLDLTSGGVKAAGGESWELAGYASTWNPTPDSYGDVVMPGAFAASLKSGRKIPLLWQHHQDEPIGRVLELYEDAKGLYGRWRIVPTDTGTKARELVRHELVDGLSIGFVTKQAQYTKDDVRLVKEVELFEISVVTLPARDDARIDSWKAQRGLLRIDDPRFEALALDIASRRAGLQRRRLRALGVEV